jgi:hypothetical protein
VFKVEIDQQDMGDINQKLLGMVRTIDQFGRRDLGNVLSAWQTQDLHRKKPHTKRSRRKAYTIIRPHSYWEMQKSKRFLKRAVRRHRLVQRPSERPILRAGLWEQFVTEMTTRFHDVIKW